MGDNGPLHKLDGAKGDNVLVHLKASGGREETETVSGTLRAFDRHLNMWLEDATLESDETETHHGTLFVRGDNVIVISPE
ncbi:MAG: LSM domain-containing protein [Candidatus Nanohaloarchaea archaeon]|nr:LSM domain-containing protein [Candidatus Nanohaloarchaea archaeon]